MTYRICMCGLLLFFSPCLQANTAKQLQHHEIIAMQQNLAQLYQAKDAFQIEESLAIQEFQKMSGNERATDNQQRLDQEYANLLIECAPERVGEIIEECKLSLACKNKEDRDALRTTSLLLVGPPGNGKSDLARAIAQAMGVPFVFVDCGNLANEYQNSAVSNLDKAIKLAESLGNGFVVVVLQLHLKSLLQEELVDEKAISRIIDQTDNFSC